MNGQVYRMWTAPDPEVLGHQLPGGQNGESVRIRRAKLSTGITMEYALEGAAHARTLLFLHGNGPNLRQFEVQVPYFAGDYRVLLVSLRGHGGSSGPEHPTVADYTVGQLARDVEALLQHLDIDWVHVVGNSLGGLVGYELLDRDPGRIASLTTFGTTAELHSSRLALWTVLATIRLLGVQRLAWLMRRTASPDKAVAARVANMFAMASKEALLLISRNIADYDYTGTLRRHQVPLLLIRGGLDREINANLGSTLDVFHDKPNALVVELLGAGHFANMEKPRAFNEILARFLEEQPLERVHVAAQA
jgi:3-oxoadipate enol-lactonase